MQVAICVYQLGGEFRELSERARPAAGPGAGSSLLLVAGILAVAALSTFRASPPRAERFAITGLGTIAALGLAHVGFALTTGRLEPRVTWVILAACAAAALAARRALAAEPHGTRVTLRAPDLVSAALLTALVATCVFPYIHFDARAIWACRALGFERTGVLAAVGGCEQPNYPPLYSVLLWLGGGDPLFQGRLVPFLALVLFAVLFRIRLARVDAELAAPALLFFLATVQVWQGAAVSYANVPLMVFLSAGALLALDVPRGARASSPIDGVAGALCLAAAALVRPDGLYYVCVLAAAAACALGRQLSRRFFLCVGSAFLSAAAWALRPASVREAGDFYTHSSGGWRESAATPALAALKTFGVFLDGLIGQWLAHNGFGAAFYLLLGVAFVRLRGRAAASDETRLYELVTWASLAAVAFCYAVIPFVGEPVIAVPPPNATYLDRYIRFIWVGLGRMTLHLYPFAALYFVGVLRDAAMREGTRLGSPRALDPESPPTVRAAAYRTLPRP